jgi:hypothetical protein
LFIGLAALSCSSRIIAARAAVAGTLAALGALVWPEGRSLVAVMAAIASALPGRDR